MKLWRSTAIAWLVLAPLWAGAQQLINCAPSVPCSVGGPVDTGTGDSASTGAIKINTNALSFQSSISANTSAIATLNGIVTKIPAGNIWCNATGGLAYPSACATLPSGFVVGVANGGNGTATPALTGGTNITITGSWPNYTITAAGSVTSASVVSANGFSGSVVNAASTPAITLNTTIYGPLKGSSGALAAASYADIAGLWGCTGSNLLAGGGGCVTVTTPPVCSGDTSGVTDTPVMQGILTSGKSLQMAECTYYINAALTVPAGYRFYIRGVSRNTIINQVTNNTPILDFTGNNTNDFDIGYFTCQWTNNQTTSQTGANCIQFQTGNSSGNIFQFSISHVVCSNGYRCISVANDGESVWGFTVDNCTQGGSMQGAFFAETGASVGVPNMRFRDIYLGPFSTSVAVAEGEFLITNGDQVLLEGIEFNGGYITGPTIVFTSVTGGTLINVKQEGETIVGAGAPYGTPIWEFQNSDVALISPKLLSATVNSGTATFIYDYPATYGYLSIDNGHCAAIQGTGSSNMLAYYKNGANTTGLNVTNFNVNTSGTGNAICANAQPTVSGGSNTLVSSVIRPQGVMSYAAATVTIPTAGTYTLVMTMPQKVGTGWTCGGTDVTQHTAGYQTGSGSTTACSVYITTGANGDTVVLNASGS